MKRRTVIAEELRRLELDNGRLLAEDVVLAASSPDSPLHDQFEWDDSKAAAAHRLDQARELIRSVRIELLVGERRVITVAYVRDPEAEEKNEAGYQAVRVLRGNAERAREAIVNEFASAAAHLRRARDLATVLGFADEVQKLADDVVRVRASIEAV